MYRERTDLIIVHCAATTPSMDIGIKEINAWHLDQGIFSEAGPSGYHFVIRRNGTLEPGRAMWAQGAHARGFNHCSVGICLVGGARHAKEGETPEWSEFVADNNFKLAQYITLVDVLSVLKHAYPNARVIGHHEVNERKSCPVFEVDKFMSRSEAEAEAIVQEIARIRAERG